MLTKSVYELTERLPFRDCRLIVELGGGTPLFFMARTREPVGGKGALGPKSLGGFDKFP